MNNKHTAVSFAILAALALTACSRQPAQQPLAEQAPAPAQSGQTVEGAFSIGELSAIALRDGGMDVPNDNKIFGVGKTPEDVAQVLTAAGLPADKLSLFIDPLLVKTSDRVLLFDTGAGTNFGPSGGKLTKSLADAGVDAGSITDVFISHPHGDHIGGLVNAEGALAFPNAAIHMAAADWAFMKEMSAETAAGMGIGKHDAVIAATSPKVTTFEPGAELIPGAVKAVEIRGHSPGHSGFLIGSGDSSLLYIADTMHHHVISVQKPDWSIAFDGDAPTSQQSRNELLAQTAASGQRIYAVHFPYPGLGKFEKRGESYVWVAE